MKENIEVRFCNKGEDAFYPTPRIALFVRPLVTKFQPHHRYMQHSQVSRIIDMCIIHTCIRVKDRGS